VIRSDPNQASFDELLSSCPHGSHRRRPCPSLQLAHINPELTKPCECCGTAFAIQHGHLTRCRYCQNT
jgi:hypothetical protein